MTKTQHVHLLPLLIAAPAFPWSYSASFGFFSPFSQAESPFQPWPCPIAFPGAPGLLPPDGTGTPSAAVAARRSEAAADAGFPPRLGCNRRARGAAAERLFARPGTTRRFARRPSAANGFCRLPELRLPKPRPFSAPLSPHPPRPGPAARRALAEGSSRVSSAPRRSLFVWSLSALRLENRSRLRLPQALLVPPGPTAPRPGAAAGPSSLPTRLEAPSRSSPGVGFSHRLGFSHYGAAHVGDGAGSERRTCAPARVGVRREAGSACCDHRCSKE